MRINEKKNSSNIFDSYDFNMNKIIYIEKAHIKSCKLKKKNYEYMCDCIHINLKLL